MVLAATTVRVIVVVEYDVDVPVTEVEESAAIKATSNATIVAIVVENLMLRMLSRNSGLGSSVFEWPRERSLDK